jgi:hypothetical protein
LFWGRKKKEVAPTIYTEETCENCGEKNRRSFEDGDYIYKNSSSVSICKKCSSTNTTMITAIYGEYPPEKQKKDN